MFLDLMLDIKMASINKSTFLQLRFGHQMHSYLENADLVTVINALSASHLVYYNATLQTPIFKKKVQKLQSIWNTHYDKLLTGAS